MSAASRGANDVVLCSSNLLGGSAIGCAQAGALIGRGQVDAVVVGADSIGYSGNAVVFFIFYYFI